MVSKVKKSGLVGGRTVFDECGDGCVTSLPLLKAPFPWFGGKSAAGHLVAAALGDVGNYIEPFAGSLGAFLAFPRVPRVVTLNDADGYIINFWRAVQAAPAEVARWADWPVSELDLTARHAWLVTQGRERVSRLQSDPDYFDAKVAGWWVWGLCSWIGSGWCSGKGPWSLDESGTLVKRGNAGRGINRQIPHLGNAGRGINRKLPHLGNAGRGINRRLTHLGAVMESLSERLHGARITCGDWSRVLGPSVTRHSGVCGVFLDPPYLTGADLYSATTEADIALKVREWALANAGPRLRVVLAGYEGEYDMPGWGAVRWRGRGATYGSAKRNNTREVLWCSPSCATVSDGRQPEALS